MIIFKKLITLNYILYILFFNVHCANNYYKINNKGNPSLNIKYCYKKQFFKNQKIVPFLIIVLFTYCFFKGLEIHNEANDRIMIIKKNNTYNNDYYKDISKCYSFEIENKYIEFEKKYYSENKSNILKKETYYLKKLIENQVLEVFTQIFTERIPNIYSQKCNFFISSIIVNKKFYLIDNSIVPRNCTEYSNICQAYDWRQHLSYLYNKFKDIRKYFLILEDDVKLCPNIFEYIYNLTILNKNSLDLNINFVLLSKGINGYLVKVDFIPKLISWMGLNNTIFTNNITFSAQYFNKRKKHYNNFLSFYNDLGQAIDYFIGSNQKDSLITGIYGSSLSLIWHPNKNVSNSIMGHSYKENNKCFIPLSWTFTRSRAYLIELNSMYVKHSSEFPYSNLRLPGGWRKFKLNRSQCTQDCDFHQELHQKICKTDCTKMIPIWNKEEFF